MPTTLLLSKLNSSRNWLILLTLLLSLLFLYRLSLVKQYTSPYPILNQDIHYLHDTKDQYSIETIQAVPSQEWQQANNMALSFGFNRQPIWVTLPLATLPSKDKWLLEIGDPLLDQVDIWINANGKQVGQYHLGDNHPFGLRPILSEKFLLPLPSAEQPLTIIMRITTSGAFHLPLTIWQQSDYLAFNAEQNLLMGLIFGFMAAMAFSNLIFFLTTGSTNFLLYSAYTLCLGLTLATLQGQTFKYLWPNNVWFQNISMALFSTITCLLAVLFTAKLLDMKQHNPIIQRFINYLTIALVLSISALFIVPSEWYLDISFIVSTICMAGLYALCLWLCVKKVQWARSYTLAWSVLLFSALLSSLVDRHIINVSLPDYFLLMVGAIIETILLALILVLDYRDQRQQLIDAGHARLLKEQELIATQQEIIEMQEQAHAELEYSVGERTLELEVTLRELSETNRELEEINTIDPLTGIRNRRYFDKKYIAEVRRSRREQTSFCVAMMDIDHFKKINDQYGHLVGDDCIRFVAQSIAAHLKRPSDDVCRYGGEEFAVLLPNTNEKGAVELLEQLTQLISNKPIPTNIGEVTLTISTGIASQIQSINSDDMALLETADKALYQAKNAGRNRVVSIPLAATETTES